MGLRSDPRSHAWHGTLPPEKRVILERDLRLPGQAVVLIEAFPTPEENATPRPEPPGGPYRPSPRPGGVGAHQALRDGSRTRAEALVAFPDADQDTSPTAIRGRLTLLDTTSGLPDDSREADEPAGARRLADLRGQVKAARKAIAVVPGAADAMRGDLRKEAAFLARFGVTQAQFRQGVPAGAVETPGEDTTELLGSPVDGREEIAAPAVPTLPALAGLLGLGPRASAGDFGGRSTRTCLPLGESRPLPAIPKGFPMCPLGGWSPPAVASARATDLPWPPRDIAGSSPNPGHRPRPSRAS
jgi:hypothetical protein